MSYRQIRINKTEELQEVLNELHRYYKSMSEADLCKMFLVQAYVQLQQCPRLLPKDAFRNGLLMQASQVFQIHSDDEPDNIAQPNTLKPFPLPNEV